MSFGDFQPSSSGRGPPGISSSSSSSSSSLSSSSSSRTGAPSTYQNTAGEAEHERLLGVVTNNVQQLQYNVTRLNAMVKTLGTDRDTKDHRSKLRQMVDSTRDLAKETGELFKKLTMAQADNVPKAKIAHDRLRKNFETWLKEFQDVSKLSVAKEREFQPRPDDDAAVFAGIGSGPNAGLSSGLGGRGAHFTEQEEAALEQQRIAEERRTKFQQLEQQRELERALIEERDKGIRDIEASVVTVNEIFQDLAALVEEQGDMIDNIESNVASTEQNTKEGTAELRKANEYQKSSRKKLCYLLLCLVILCGVVAGVYFAMRKN